MPADVQIRELTWTNTGVDKTGSDVYFKFADDTNSDSNDPIPIPVSGSAYSYTKQFQLYINNTPMSQITNLKAYTSGTNNLGTGYHLQYDTQSSWSANVNTNISGTDLFTATSSSPINLGAGPYTSVGYIGSILRIQAYVDSTATPTMPAPTVFAQLTFAYDEQ